MISEGDDCRLGPAPVRIEEPRRVAMVEPEAVAAMLRLKELGWGPKRIARELGVNRRTVKRYLETGGWHPYKKPKRQKLLDGLEVWLRERLRQHRGNADVVRQELLSEKALLPVEGQCNARLTLSPGTSCRDAGDSSLRDAAR